MYLYVDTDKLDPNSDLGKVARRNAGAGQGLGESGKSDLAFTGLYAVEKKADGSLGLGRSTATFWGGRDEISAVMREQLKYAKAATLNLGGGTTPDRQPDSKPSTNPEYKPSDQRPVSPQTDDQADNPSDRRILPPPPPPPPDGGPSVKPENSPADQNKDQSKEQERKELDDQKRKDEETQKEREKLKKERQKQIQEAGGKNYPIDEYATGWGRFLERNEVQAGPMRDALDEFGRSMILGEFDGKKLADIMNKVEPADAKTWASKLENANGELALSGIKLNVELEENGKVSGLELTEIAKPGAPRVSVRATSAGDIKGGILSGTSLRELPLGDASIRLAKRAEPAACP